MVTRDTAWLPGTPCWVDVTVPDVGKATAFYTSLFGWQADINPDPAFGGYGRFSKDGRDVAGVGPAQDPAQPTVWTTYIASDDVDQTAGKISSAGGQVLFEPMDVGEFGRMLVAMDPGGAAFGVWQSGTNTGMRLANEPGSVTWNENRSRDVEASKKFYTAVFGYEYESMETGDTPYAMAQLDGSAVAGVMPMPAGTPAEIPSHWLTYFAVADTDATVAKAVELGGRVVLEAMDTPQGRMAFLADDQGPVFAVIQV